MTKQSTWVVGAILVMGGLLLAGCGASTATPPAGQTICSPQGGWCLTLRRAAVAAMVTVTCPARSCSCDAAFQAALGGWAVVATGTAPGRPWSLTLPLPAIRAPREAAA